ncbi:hypothetical protein [Lysobacter enzymogenes]|uniref:hypothetical protein n=1 Tax=Lysobacter enzymogenes TaxID=69 RepID=UPI001A972208|nr:hypothetical protein [Lysobacter enzymogenes]QQP97941.1 hypothetical protein JHW38_08040 [Lysobacter enzymogenes]
MSRREKRPAKVSFEALKPILAAVDGLAKFSEGRLILECALRQLDFNMPTWSDADQLAACELRGRIERAIKGLPA